MKHDNTDNQRAGKDKMSQLRLKAGMSQAELAGRCGVSRQFLSMVESGKTQPNVQFALRLAAELGASVEELFGGEEYRKKDGVLSVQLAQPSLREGTRIAVARVEGRWIAHPSDSADSLGGGFAESDAVLRWSEGRAEAHPHRLAADLERNIAIAGCDPALSLLRGSAIRSVPLPGRCFWVNCGSARALQLLSEGWVHAAGIHASGGEAADNLRQVRRLDPQGHWQLLHFTQWESGWMVRPDVQTKFQSTADLAEGRFRLVNRETGSGNRQWLDGELARLHLSSSRVEGYDRELLSHWECARALREGQADVAVGPRAIAMSFGLGFIPVGDVSFNLVIPKIHLSHPSVQAVMDRVRSSSFRREIETLPGYGAPAAGSVLG